MNEQLLSSTLKGWLAGCLTATATLFAVGFIKQTLHPDGLAPASLAAGIFVAFAHLAFIIILSAIPAAAVIWITHALRAQFVLIFAISGAAIGWLGQRVIPPWPDTATWPFVLAGLVAGGTYWFVAVHRRPAN
jgi:hypothetical protein